MWSFLWEFMKGFVFGGIFAYFLIANYVDLKKGVREIRMDIGVTE